MPCSGPPSPTHDEQLRGGLRQSTSELVASRGQNSRSGSPGGEGRSLTLTRRNISDQRNSQDFERYSEASNISLYDFRKAPKPFHWEGTSKIYQTVDTHTFPLRYGHQLSRADSNAKVWQAKIQAERHGFTDNVAVKVVRYGTEKEQRAAKTEVVHLRKICHNHIVAFLGYYIKMGEEVNHMGILMFPVAALSLEAFLESPDILLRREMMLPWFGCLTRALEYLHNLPFPIKHRDIKPANILIDKSDAVFLTDFDTSKEYKSHADAVTSGTDRRYTPRYVSPQMIEEESVQGIWSDMFCLGCVFLEMATVILCSNRDNLNTYIEENCGCSPGEIEFHRHYEVAIKYIQELRKRFQNKPAKPYETCLLNEGLDMISSTIRECAVGDAVSHGVICEVLDKLPTKPCQSCSNPVQSIPEDRRALEEHLGFTLPFINNGDEQTNPDKRPVPTGERLDFLNEISADNVLHQPQSNPEPSHGASNQPQQLPTVALQRQATDVRDFAVPNDGMQRDKTRLMPVIKSPPTIAQMQPKNPSLQDVEIIDKSESEVASDTVRSMETSENDSRSEKHNQTKLDSSDALISEPNLPHPPRVNSKIRMVECHKKRPRVVSFDDYQKIPGSQILVFDPAERRWTTKQKGNVNLQSGILWRLPRGLHKKYPIPPSDGYFRPWKELSFKKNCKRIFGRSMLTAFIEGRRTPEELEAFLDRSSKT